MTEEPGPDPAPAEPETCANCGEPLGGRFCSVCGQEDRNLARMSVGRLVRDWLGDVLTFDSRFFRTVGPLIRRPGLLTLEYLAGRQRRYVPPLRLFVFVSLVMFLVLGLTGVQFSWNVSADGEVVSASGRQEERLREASEDQPPAAAADTASETEEGASDDGLDIDPEEINRRLLDWSPQVMFVLAPLFAFFVWVLQRRRSPYYMSHLVFSLHVHSFWFLVVMAAALVNAPFPEKQPGKILMLALAPYLYLALRRVYGGGRLVNILRTAVLGFVQLFAWGLAMLGALLLTVVLA